MRRWDEIRRVFEEDFILFASRVFEASGHHDIRRVFEEDFILFASRVFEASAHH
jgi:hypothetical protein